MLEIIDDFDRDTYRATYTVKFAGVVYVLHAVQKKSKRGTKTPKQDLDPSRAGSGTPRGMDEAEEHSMTMKMKVEQSSGNVLADLGRADANEALLKARLAQRIAAVIEKRSLSQSGAAEILGIDQPRVSKLLRSRLQEFSTDRLLRFLNALDQDVEITVKPKPRSRKHARLSVVGA